MIKHKCEECKSIFDFKKEDFKEFVFAKNGDTFIKTDRKKQRVNMFGNKIIFIETKYRLTKDLKFKGIKCPICDNIDWKVKELISNPTSLKQDGWYILTYAPKLIEVEEIDRKFSEYKISRFEAKQYAIEDLAGVVIK
jgi:hypothetical protein